MRRREFLQVGAGAAAGLLVPATVRTSAADAGSDAFADFKVGVQSYCFRKFTLPEALKHMEALGLGFVELYPGHAPLEMNDREAQALLKQCLDHGVTPAALGVVPFSKDHGKNRRAFEHAKRLGIQALSADPETDSFDSLDRLVEEYDVAIAIHPHGPVGNGKLHLWHRAEIILEAVQDHHPLVGTCLDTGHLIRCGLPPHNIYIDPVQQIRLMGPRNFGIHLKDNDNKINHNVIVGQGALDVPGVFRALRKVQFNGCISIEHEANPDDPVPDIKACVDVIKEAIRSIA
ncbi:MAG: sugar phosphate isomerase/epimerase [Pirellulaceae bacterium]|nr:sugar phosphate isomerase/epimerase [Pirellulaceae bacterium]